MEERVKEACKLGNDVKFMRASELEWSIYQTSYSLPKLHASHFSFVRP